MTNSFFVKSAASLADRIQTDKPRKLSYGERASGVGKASLGGAVTGALGTSGVLGLGSLVLGRKYKVLGKMLGEAAGDGLRVFNPANAYRLARSTPEATRLFGKEMDFVRKMETSAGSPAGARYGIFSNPNSFAGNKHLIPEAQAMKQDVARFSQQHGMTPQQSVTQLIGGISGVASAAAGGAVGGSGYLRSNPRQTT